MKIARLLSLLALLTLVAAGFLGASCTGKDEPTTPSARSDKDKTGPRSARAGDDDDGDRGKGSAKDKSTNGWRWAGKRGDCFYLVDNRCFDKREAACKAARCGSGACATDDGAPAKVRCKK